MAKAHIGDDVLHNILAGLPGKSLLRFRCVCKHWNRLISDPYFMKSRSRRMIFLAFPRPFTVIDDNVPVHDKAHSMVTIRPPLEYEEGIHHVTTVGTLNGIVLLALYDTDLRYKMILYNPLTCASKTLLVMDPPARNVNKLPYILGLACGDDDLKLVRLELFDIPSRLRYKYDVFDFKTNSWSMTPRYLITTYNFTVCVGTFLNGFLYWKVSIGVLALNVKDMVFSVIELPNGLDYTRFLWGSRDGCLCIMVNRFHNIFEVWSREEKYWMGANLFGSTLEGKVYFPICVLGNRKFLLANGLMQLVIYDTSKRSYKTVNDEATFDDLEKIWMIFDFFEIEGSYDQGRIHCFVRGGKFPSQF